ncbi:hypothetical protein CLCR_03202 [Cladophialophora carrionii]|uniref:Uncharacterized protein n=1 Tax=Cladophialophora carrionii TaxID=86049 RepID=A0A1C1D2A3_9EURO|nr:hypothetical protein CLCR_03202 [Cladophialophora carrionii]
MQGLPLGCSRQLREPANRGGQDVGGTSKTGQRHRRGQSAAVPAHQLQRLASHVAGVGGSRGNVDDLGDSRTTPLRPLRRRRPPANLGLGGLEPLGPDPVTGIHT